MVYRRLYFLFHDVSEAHRIITALEQQLWLGDYQVHTLMNGAGGFAQVPNATVQRKSPGSARLEQLLWYLSIALFACALMALVLALLAASWWWALLCALIVLLSQWAGYMFTNRIPNPQLDRFRTALAHGEILMLIDVPPGRVRAVKQLVYSRYPEAKTNGANWHLNVFGT